MLEGINTLYDNSKPFSTFLMKEGLEDILRETELGLRQKHTIVPHVCRYDFSLMPSYLLFQLICYLYSAKWDPCKRHQVHCPCSPMRRAGIIMCGEIQCNFFRKSFTDIFIID